MLLSQGKSHIWFAGGRRCGATQLLVPCWRTLGTALCEWCWDRTRHTLQPKWICTHRPFTVARSEHTLKAELTVLQGVRPTLQRQPAHSLLAGQQASMVSQSGWGPKQKALQVLSALPNVLNALRKPSFPRVNWQVWRFLFQRQVPVNWFVYFSGWESSRPQGPRAKHEATAKVLATIAVLSLRACPVCPSCGCVPTHSLTCVLAVPTLIHISFIHIHRSRQ